MSKHVHVIEVSTGQHNFATNADLFSFLDSFKDVYPSYYNPLEAKISSMRQEGSLLSSKIELVAPFENVFRSSKVFTTIQKAVEYNDWIIEGDGFIHFSYICDGLGWSVNNTQFVVITEERWNEIQQEINFQ